MRSITPLFSSLHFYQTAGLAVLELRDSTTPSGLLTTSDTFVFQDERTVKIPLVGQLSDRLQYDSQPIVAQLKTDLKEIADSTQIEALSNAGQDTIEPELADPSNPERMLDIRNQLHQILDHGELTHLPYTSGHPFNAIRFSMPLSELSSVTVS